MSRNLDPDAGGNGYSHPYRSNRPPEPTTRRRIVTTKDEVQILEDDTEIRLPVEDRQPAQITRITSFGVDVDVVEYVREDQDR